jgi:para-nitrobenzyl esterase
MVPYTAAMPIQPLSRRRFISASALASLSFAARPLLAFNEPAAVTVESPSGPLVGSQASGIRVFRGVPFAEPPVGPLRFHAPVPIKPWTAPRDATRPAPSAMQPGGDLTNHSEDCLYLNIWAPAGDGLFPVYVWIHGGGFTAGSPNDPRTDGSVLAARGIVAVSVAYRLGVFGFLDLEPLLGGAYAGSANNGLRDLIAALEWTHRNIAAFGGDPSRITIGGESAGAKLTCILMGAPSAQPLFSQMISESGGAERVASREVSLKVAEDFAQSWRGITGSAPGAVAAAAAAQLIDFQQKFIASYPVHFPLRCQIDGTLLPRLPVETILAGCSRGKRLLIGTNRDESAAFLGPHPDKDPTAADLGNLPLATFNEVFAKYPAVYPSMTAEQLRIRAVTAEEYWIPTVRVTGAHLAGGGSAYMYRLDFSETSGRLRGYAFHALDVPLVWNRPHTDVANAGIEAALAGQMHDGWVAFLEHGKPAGVGLPNWPAYDTAHRWTVTLDTQESPPGTINRIESNPQEAELELWDGLL